MTEDQASTTVRPAQSKLPTSLRHLFGNDVASNPDSFRIPGFSATGKDAVSGIPGSPVPPHSPATPLPLARDRAARRALRIENGPEDALNLSTAAFAFPPRATPKAMKVKVGSSLPPPDDQANSFPGNPDKPFTIPGSSLSETSVIGSSTPVPVPVPSTPLGRHDLRLDSGDPDLEIPSQGSGHETTFRVTANDDWLSADARLSPALSRRSPSSRSRSESTAQGPTSGLEQNPPNPSIPGFQLALPSSRLHQVQHPPSWQDLIRRHLPTTHLMTPMQDRSLAESNPSEGLACIDLPRSQLWRHRPPPRRQDPGQSLGEVEVVTLQAVSAISLVSPTSRTC